MEVAGTPLELLADVFPVLVHRVLVVEVLGARGREWAVVGEGPGGGRRARAVF